MDEQYVVPQYVVPDDGVSRQSAADLLHQFALAALPEIIRAHPGYAAKTVSVEAYSVASYMVEQGKRAEMEARNPKVTKQVAVENDCWPKRSFRND